MSFEKLEAIVKARKPGYSDRLTGELADLMLDVVKTSSQLHLVLERLLTQQGNSLTITVAGKDMKLDLTTEIGSALTALRSAVDKLETP